MNYTSPRLETIGAVSELIQGGPLPALDHDAINGRNVGNLLDDTD